MGEAAAVPHALLVSFPAQGHVNPLLRLAKRLAAKGLLVTFSTCISIGRRILSSSSLSDDSLIPVGRGHLRFEFFSDGWPDVDPRRDDLDVFMPQLRTHCPPALKDLIAGHAHRQPITCIVNNPFVPWVLDVAEELSIPSAVLWVQSCSVFSTYYHYVHEPAYFDDAETNGVKLPGIPELKLDELPTFLVPSNPYKALTEVILSQFANLEKARWVFANSFDELEHEIIQAIPMPVIPVGPLVDDVKSDSNNVKGHLWKAADGCLEWLDQQSQNSVVYISLGSIVVLTKNEMHEMANGLINCDKPFIWVVREDSRSLLPEDFIMKTSESKKGMIVSWSPQEQVLEHESLGCFVTHCGWNSTLEAVTAGVPVIAYPQWGDQVPDAKFLVDVYGVGVRMGAPVTRKEVERCVREVVDEGEGMRGRAAEWREKARTAVADGGSSDRNLEKFVEEVTSRACGQEITLQE